MRYRGMCEPLTTHDDQEGKSGVNNAREHLHTYSFQLLIHVISEQ